MRKLRALLCAFVLWLLPAVALAQVTAAGVDPDTMPVPMFSKKAIEFLESEYAVRPRQEFLGCMLGFVTNGVVHVQRIVWAKGQAGDSNSVTLPSSRSCQSDYDNVLGNIHSHTQAELLKGDKCSYYHEVNGQQRWLEDLVNFRYGPHNYVADAIFCGDRITWLDVGYRERVLHRQLKG